MINAITACLDKTNVISFFFLFQQHCQQLMDFNFNFWWCMWKLAKIDTNSLIAHITG